MNRSAGVTVIAILAMIGSGLALAMGALTAVGLLLGPGPKVYGDYPGSPVFFRAIMLLVPLVYILPGIWGIVTGVGLLQTKSWARVSTIVFSILLVAFGVIFGLGSTIFFLSSPPPGLDRQAMAFVRVFMVTLAAAQIGIGVWWLVFFNRPRVREQFVARPSPTNPTLGAFTPAPGNYPVQASYHVEPPPAIVVPTVPEPPKRPLSITIIAWFILAGCLFLPINLALHTPASMFVWLLTGRPAAAFFLVAVALLLYIGVGLLRLNPYARVVGIGYFVFGVANSAIFFLAPGGRGRAARILEQQQSLFPGMPQFPDPMPLILIGGIIGMIFSLVPLYFLITNKPAFRQL